METLTEELCLEITKWSKTDFIECCSQLQNIRNSEGRKKEELLAIFRFWLTRGSSQSSIALLKKECNQQRISNYLQSIRDDLNRDFLPNWLGTNRPREFFIQRNNASIDELYQLEDTVTIIVDGTYTRCQKSRINQMEYSTYMKYKFGNLLKPFVAVCPDGWVSVR